MKAINFLSNTLRGRLILGVATLNAVIMLLFVLDLTVQQRASLLNHQVEEATALAQALSLSAAGWIVADDISGLQELVKAQGNNPELIFATLADKNGKVLAHSDSSKLGLYLTDLPKEARPTIITKSAKLVDVAVPAMLAGRLVGWSRIGIDELSIEKELGKITRNGILYGLAAVLLGSSIVWGMGRGITTRLYAIQRAMKKIRQGDHSVRVKVVGTDEAADIAEEFNIMLDTLDERDAKLNQSEQKFRMLTDNSPLAIVICSGIEQKATFYNQTFTKMFGYTLEEAPSVDFWWSLAYPDEGYRQKVCSVWNQRVATAIETGVEIVPMETEVTCKDGSKKYISWKYLPGNLEDWVFGLDLTERKQAEEAHSKLEEQLRQAQKMEAIGTLAGGIAHDFNNILNVIIGYGSMLMERMENDPLSKQQLTDVLAAADRAANLTKRLLAFSRKQAVEVKPVNVNEIIVGMEKMLSRIVSEDIAFTLELASRRMIVLADSGQIEQVLLNLVANARYAMQTGGKLMISTGIEEITDEYVATSGYGKAGTYACISVKDSGCGMDQETRNKIFEPFFTTKGTGEGTGLGLAIVYGIIKQHEGYVNVRSEPGKGSEFIIYLPLAQGPAEMAPKVETLPAIEGGTETILIAEDDPQLRELSRFIFEPYGYTVITAENGEDAVARFREKSDSIDMVILDMIMPKKNGKEAYEEIRSIKLTVKALFVSGYTMDTISQKNLLDEGMDFIHKPVFPNVLLKKVREILDR